MDSHKPLPCKAIGSRHAFTLVEMAIVLAILGILVGGILIGQSMMYSAGLRSVATEFQRYQTAMHQFNERFNGIPGDLSDATKYWDTASACPGVYADANPNSSATCNGNGDGMVLTSTYSFEIVRFWQHLANAGMIEGRWPGVAGPGSSLHKLAGFNVPASRLGKPYGYAPYYMGPRFGTVAYFDGDYGNALSLEYTTPTTTTVTSMRPDDLWNIDLKLDDGKPGYGTLRSQRNSANCTVSSAVNTDYRLDYKDMACTNYFITGL